MAKKSFFEKIAGTIRMKEPETDYETDQYEEVSMDPYYEEDIPMEVKKTPERKMNLNDPSRRFNDRYTDSYEVDEPGELSVDVYHTDDAIYVKAMTAGVRKSDLDIVITRDQITLSGKRYDTNSVNEDQYFHKELYWGTFTRVIDLPFEIDIEAAIASEENGLVTLKLPKIDKYRTARIRVA